MDAANRFWLALLGLLLAAAGVVGLLAAAGAIPVEQPADSYARAADTVLGRPDLWWPVIFAALALLLLLGLWIAWREASARYGGPGVGTVQLDRGERGRTTLDASAVAGAASADLRRVPQVVDASVRMVGYGPVPKLVARVDTLADADLDAVRQGSEDVLQRVQRAVGVAEVNADIRLRPTRREAPRVR